MGAVIGEAWSKAGDEQRSPVGAATRLGRWASLARRNWLFFALLVAGVTLRVLVTIAYWPALEVWNDSYKFLSAASTLRPGQWDPMGYSLFLAGLSHVGPLAVVPIIQHAMGLAIGAILYALLLRLGVRRPLAALGAAPALLDGFQLDIEQFVLGETLAELLLVAALALFLSRRHLRARWGLVLGLLLTAAALTRLALLAILVLLALDLLLRWRWRALLAYLGVGGALLVAYGGWFASANGSFGLSESGYFLYGRVAPFATCDYHLSAAERRLCPAQPVNQRTRDPNYWDWTAGSPLLQPGLGSRDRRSALASSFARQVVLHQPLSYARAVIADTWHYAVPGRSLPPGYSFPDVQQWDFPGPNAAASSGYTRIYFADYGFGARPIHAAVDPSLMGPLRAYQSVAYTQGPLLLLSLLGGLLVGAGLLRRSAGRREARRASLLLALAGLVTVLGSSATAGFSYRYGLTMLVLLPPAGVLAADVAIDAAARRWKRYRSGPSARRSSPADLAQVSEPLAGSIR